MTARKRTTGGPKAEKAKAPRQPKKAKDPSKIDLLRNAIANAPLDVMLVVDVVYVAPGVYEAQWTADGLQRAYRGTYGQIRLWVCACVAEGRLLTDMTNAALERIAAARVAYEAQRAA